MDFFVPMLDVYFGGPSTDSTPENGRSESESEPLEHQSTIADEGIMLEEALTLLSKRWERMDCAQALRMLPSDTTLQVFLFTTTTMVVDVLSVHALVCGRC